MKTTCCKKCRVDKNLLVDGIYADIRTYPVRVCINHACECHTDTTPKDYVSCKTNEVGCLHPIDYKCGCPCHTDTTQEWKNKLASLLLDAGIAVKNISLENSFWDLFEEALAAQRESDREKVTKEIAKKYGDFVQLSTGQRLRYHLLPHAEHLPGDDGSQILKGKN